MILSGLNYEIEKELLMQEVAPWLSVPQFGAWEHKGEVPDYSFDFSKHKRDLSINNG